MGTKAMMLLILSALLLLAVACLYLWRLMDHRTDRIEMERLLETQPLDPEKFDSRMLAGLPGVARRYFEFTILPGTPLHTAAHIFMTGQFSLGTKDAPAYLNMIADQVLAAPIGFVWKMTAKNGLMQISGSDSASWTRFWVMGLIPVTRMGGNRDHARSAFGRYVAEAVFWTPAALLPGPGIRWEAVDGQTAKVVISHGELEQAVYLTVDKEGRPIKVSFPRWSNANPEKVFRIQRFGGYLSKYREFQGFRLPTHVEAGNHFGTDNYFPFFIVDVSNIRFPIITGG